MPDSGLDSHLMLIHPHDPPLKQMLSPLAADEENGALGDGHVLPEVT